MGTKVPPLRFWRRKRRLTLAQVAAATGISVAALSRIETQRVEPTKAQIAVVSVKLCKKVVMGEVVRMAAQAAIFSNSFFCSASRLIFR